MKTEKIKQHINVLSQLLVNNREKIATAESCTGGLVSAFCTSVSGSSAWFYATIVSYDNQSKVDLLGVDKQIIKTYGAVSEQTVTAMCKGLLNKTPVDYAVSISGVAGPTGGTKKNPVGTVWIGIIARKQKANIKKYIFSGDRENIRYNAVEQALSNLISIVEE